MTDYRVFIAAEVVAALRSCSRREQRSITRLLESLGQDPYRAGDYTPNRTKSGDLFRC